MPRGTNFKRAGSERQAYAGILANSPEALKKRAETLQTKRELKEIIRTIMGSPIKDGEMFYVDGKMSLDHFKGRNTDVQTRMILQMAVSAMRGDKAAAEFLMKYGGYELPKEQNITIDRPTIIDDFALTNDEQGVPKVRNQKRVPGELPMSDAEIALTAVLKDDSDKHD